MRRTFVTVTDAASSAVIVPDKFNSSFHIGVYCTVVSGSPTFSVEVTGDDTFAAGFDPSAATWFKVSAFADKTDDVYGAIDAPCTGIRLTQTGTAVTTMTLIQSGS